MTETEPQPTPSRRTHLALALVLNALLMTALPVVVAGQSTEDTELAERYLSALYALDLSALESIAAEEIVFRDSTAVALGGDPWLYEGRDKVLDFFRSSVEGVEETGFEVVRKFTVADQTVLELVYWTRGDGELLGAPGVELHLRVPAVTVIRTKGGKVIEHQDFVDYDSLLEQVSEQSSGDTTTDNDDAAEPDIDAVADRYLAATWALDYDGMAAHLAAHARYEDYTMEYFGSDAIDRSGRDQVVDFFREANSGSQTLEVKPKIRQRFSSGSNVVLLIDVNVTVDGAAWDAPGKKLKGSGLTVTWLRIEKGLVTRHMDFADYDTAMKQFKEQGGNP